MTIYSTCGSCRDLLDVVDVTTTDHDTHPDCPTTPLGELTGRYLDAVTAEHPDRVTTLAAALERAAHPRERPLVDAALAYAAWQWPVFPLRPGGKTPATRHGFKDATTDPDRIRHWWRDQPNANIGLATGHRFDVLDVDMPTGTWSWVTIRDTNVVGDIHGIALTPRGMHIYLEATGAGNSAGLAGLPGLDYRGVGGYVVAPPSRRDDTPPERLNRYAWSVRPSPILTSTATVSAA